MSEKAENLQAKLEALRRRAELDSALRLGALGMALLSAVHLALLLVSRLLGLLPDFFTLQSAALPVALGAASGLLLRKRASLASAARTADAKLGTKDLFLTALLIEGSLGEYRQLVVERAEAEAKRIEPAKTVRIEWRAFAVSLCLACAALLPLSALLPQLDPFGLKAQERRREESKAALKGVDKELKERMEALRRKPSGKGSPEAEKALEELRKQFQSFKPEERELNAAKLQELRKNVGALLKERSDERLKDMLGRGSTQSFGKQGENAANWREQLKNGDLSGLKKALEEARALAKKASEAGSQEERKKAMEELAKALKEISAFNKSDLSSKSLRNALDSAAKELGLAGAEGLDGDFASALDGALRLGGMELGSLESMLSDLKSLEAASRALQLARSLNDRGCLRCEQAAAGEGAGSFCEAWTQAALCGNGAGAHGAGLGGHGGYDNSDSTPSEAARNELSKARLSQGKTLMEWKEKGLGPSGQAKEEYLAAVKELKQGVSEALLKERTPPGYHEAIKSYFESLAPAEPAQNGR